MRSIIKKVRRLLLRSDSPSFFDLGNMTVEFWPSCIASTAPLFEGDQMARPTNGGTELLIIRLRPPSATTRTEGASRELGRGLQA